MASVHLTFVPPDWPDIVKLYIYEAGDASSPGAQIEEVDAVGSYPDYIHEYTTSNATNENDWFSIQWEDAKGAKTKISAPMQGGTATLVGKVTERVLLRDSTLNDQVVAQEAEAAIEEALGQDPYTVDPATVSYRKMRGLVNLTLARSYLNNFLKTQVTSGSLSSWTAGLLTVRNQISSNSTQASYNTIKSILDQAISDLGINTSVILQLEDIAVANGITERVVGVDLTRLLVEIE